jgi:hypothetical protein
MLPIWLWRHDVFVLLCFPGGGSCLLSVFLCLFGWFFVSDSWKKQDLQSGGFFDLQWCIWSGYARIPD